MNRESLLRIRSLLRKEFRQLFRDPKAKRIMFGAPIMQLLLFGYAVTTDVHDVPVHVVDYDNTAASRELQSALIAGGYFQIVAVSDQPAQLQRDLDGGWLSCCELFCDGEKAFDHARINPPGMG